MAARNPHTPGLIRRLFQRIGNPLEWSEVDKCLLVGFLTLPFPLSQIGMIRRIMADPSYVPYANRAFLTPFMHVQVIVAVLWIAFILAGIWLRRRRREAPLLVHATMQLYALASSFASYAVGHWTSPAVTFLLGAGLAGLLLFDWRAALGGVFTSLLVILGTTAAEQAGVIPYAPLLSAAPYEEGHLSPWWLYQMGALTLGTLLVFLGLTSYLVFRWRDREEKLAAAYRELSRTKDRLVRAESLAAVGSLVTGAAHELRNPLASSSALFQSLKEDLSTSASIPKAEKQEALQTIDMALKGQRRAAEIAERLYQLTDDLVTEGSVASLGGSVDDLAGRYRHLQVKMAAELRNIPIPQSIFKTILPNLLENAVAAGGKEPPRLEVDLTPSELPLSINGEGAAGRGELCFTVTDTGRGIPKAQQAEVFKPFFTGQKAGEGHKVGLGLYIVHELVTRMGGTVELESEEGKGTRVTVRVPLA